MNKTALFTSNTEEWATPQSFFDALNEEFHFDLDPCATDNNHKCDSYFTKSDNGLDKDWGGHRVFCNPPYGKQKTADWIKKCAAEAQKPNTIIVLLIPARTDTKAFHEHIYQKENVEVRFVKGRLKFGGAKDSAPFPSMVCIFRGKEDLGK